MRYDPDKDAKGTRREYAAQNGEHIWVRAVREPSDFFHDLMRRADAAAHPGNLYREVSVSLAHAQWSRTRGVYVFDADLARAVDDTPLEGLTDAAFLRLPEWCVFVRVEREVAGFELVGGFVTTVPLKSGLVGVVSVPVTRVPPGYGGKGPWLYWSNIFSVRPEQPLTFRERDAITKRRGNSFHMSVSGQHIAPDDPSSLLAQALLTRAAYLCAEEPDVRCSGEPRARPQRVKNNGPVREWTVGERFGAAYRRAIAQHAAAGHRGADRSRARPHVRRAHWHTYVTGPRDGERERVLRWLPPMFVNADAAGADVPTTIWRQGRSA